MRSAHRNLGVPKSRAEGSSRSAQEYLRALALLASSSPGGAVSTGDVSSYLRVAPASVSEMLMKLGRRGDGNDSPYGGARLTPEGLREAQRVTRKHRLLERFLSDILCIPVDRVHAQASEMEHALSDEAEKAMCRLLKHPDRCPDDKQVIPACDLPFFDCDRCMEAERVGGPTQAMKRREVLFPISSLETGASGRVSFIRGESGAIRRLRGVGLKTGAHVVAGGRAPSAGLLELSVGGSNVAIGWEDAARVFVKIDTGGRG